MSIDSSACLGYGIKISKNQFEDIESGKLKISKKIETIIHGNCYKESSIHYYLVISDSVVFADSFTIPKPCKLTLSQDWDSVLLKFCEKNNIKNPVIGWFLCCTIS